jgi:cytosine/adenosine deaminase-related metal-dependent hydrolase
MGRLAGRFGMIKQLDGLGLLGPDTTYIHCCHFSEEEWGLVRDLAKTYGWL